MFIRYLLKSCYIVAITLIGYLLAAILVYSLLTHPFGFYDTGFEKTHHQALTITSFLSGIFCGTWLESLASPDNIRIKSCIITVIAFFVPDAMKFTTPIHYTCLIVVVILILAILQKICEVKANDGKNTENNNNK